MKKTTCGYCHEDIDGEPYKRDNDSGESYCCPQCWDEAIQLKRASDAAARYRGIGSAAAYKGGHDPDA